MAEEAKKTEEETKKVETETKKVAEGAETEKKAPTVEEELEVYKQKAAAAEERAAKAEREADARRRERDEARSEGSAERSNAIKSKEDALANALSAAQAAFDKAQAEWEDAYDANDKKRLLEAQKKLNDCQAALRGAEWNKNQFEIVKKRVEAGGASTDDKGGTKEKLYTFKTGAGDEIQIPKSAVDWAAKHPKFASDPECAEAVYDADGRAKRKGIEVYSDEYYEFLDKHLKKSGFDVDEAAATKKEEEKAAKKEEKKDTKSSSAAPVYNSSSMNSSTVNGTGGSKFHMTSEHIEAAAICYPDLWKKGEDGQKEAMEKYAKRQIQRLAQEGKR